jgi:predicted transcriptional regulator
MRERYLINSILRACGILKRLSGDRGAFKPSELAGLLHLDRSTAYRILLSLEKCGMVERNDKTGEYSLGLGAFEIGSAYLRRVDLVEVAKPIMADLAQRIQETVHLAVLSETEIASGSFPSLASGGRSIAPPWERFCSRISPRKIEPGFWVKSGSRLLLPGPSPPKKNWPGS